MYKFCTASFIWVVLDFRDTGLDWTCRFGSGGHPWEDEGQSMLDGMPSHHRAQGVTLYRSFGNTHPPAVHVSELWEETGVP